MSYVVSSLDRGLRILEILGESPELMGPTAIGEILEVDRSTVYRLMRTLEARQFVQQHESGRYQLGSKCIKLGTLALEYSNLPSRAKPFLEELAERSGYTVHLAILRNDRAIYVDKVQGKSILAVSTVIGGEAPMHCTASGKSFAAFMPTERMRKLYKEQELQQYTKNTHRSLESLETELEQVRRLGYAVDDEERHHGVKCVGAPVFDHHGAVVASIGVSAPSSEMEDGNFNTIKQIVLDVAHRLSDELGYSADKFADSRSFSTKP